MHSQLTMLARFQVNREGTQPYIYMYSLSPKSPSQPGFHINTEQSSICYTVAEVLLKKKTIKADMVDTNIVL